ncbi:MAG TPA: hypothetical protein VHF69_00080 [Candidatus Synoicihabitans sp.]|nr:hypothetical protein [Candidatus Synoicihabitans sp.]
MLARAAARRGYAMEATTNRTPLSDLLAQEADGEDAEGLMRARLETFYRFIDFAFADGPHPASVMRNFFAVVHALRPDALLNMSCRDIGLLLGRTGAAHSWRVKKLFSDFLKDHDARGFKARWQKSETATAAYSAAQRGNTNRRGTKKKAA